jgi:hypothetical protein
MAVFSIGIVIDVFVFALEFNLPLLLVKRRQFELPLKSGGSRETEGTRVFAGARAQVKDPGLRGCALGSSF